MLLFRREYPDVKPEIVVEADHTGLGGSGYDAGVRRRVHRPGQGGNTGLATIHMAGRCCAGLFAEARTAAGAGGPLTTPVPAISQAGDRRRLLVLVNDSTLLRTLARQGLGLIYSASINVAADIDEGTLEPVLEQFSPAQESFFAYYPRMSRSQPKLRAFIDVCMRSF